MVFGNLSDDSGTGVAFTRNPATGETGSYGDYLDRAQGEDVVAGIRNTMSLADMSKKEPVVHAELERLMKTVFLFWLWLEASALDTLRELLDGFFNDPKLIVV